MKSNKQKGEELEDAINAIERIIFSLQPGLREANITFERNKIVYLKEAKNEIDLFVHVDFGKELSTIFIFESKNWNKKVGKNEVVIFSEKVHEMKAQKGFIIAKSFTRDAISRSKTDGRVDLVKVRDEIKISSFPIGFLLTSINGVNIILDGKGIQNGQIPSDSVISMDDQNLSVQEFAMKLCDEAKLEIESDPELTLKEHIFEKEKIFVFDTRNVKLGDHKIDRVKGTFQCETKLIPYLIKSQYDVEKRGRYTTIITDMTKDLTIKTMLTQLH